MIYVFNSKIAKKFLTGSIAPIPSLFTIFSLNTLLKLINPENYKIGKSSIKLISYRSCETYGIEHRKDSKIRM